MDIPDELIGKIILATTTTIFVLLALWVNIYPLIDDDIYFYSLTPDPKWFLLGCAAWGVFFVGGLLYFTLYHIYPYM